MAKIPFSAELCVVGVDSTDVFMQTQKFPDNKIVCLQHVAVANETTGDGYATVGFGLGNNYYWLETLIFVNAGHYVALKNPVIMRSVRNITVKIHLSNANEMYRAFVYGYYEE